MKTKYPIYKYSKDIAESETAFNKFSKKNQDKINELLQEHGIGSKSAKRNNNRKRAWIKMIDFLEKDWDKISYNDYVMLAKAMSESSLGVDVLNDDRSFDKRFLKDCYDDWEKRFKGLKLLKSETKGDDKKIHAKDLATDKEIEDMISISDSIIEKGLVSCYDESTARPEELPKVRVCDVDFEKKLIYLFSGKTKKKRDVPINYSLGHLKRIRDELNLKDDDFFFPSPTDRNKPMNNTTINNIFKKLRKKAGIRKYISPLRLRHRRLSYLITKLSPKVYEQVAGHSLAMGMKTYAHLSTDKIIKEMREKVFEIEELNPDERTSFENRIDKLESKMDIIATLLTKKAIGTHHVTEQEEARVKKAVELVLQNG